MTIEHKNIPNADLHEPKGAAGAADKEVYVADGAGSGSFKQPVHHGFWDYEDNATGAIDMPTAGSWVKITNDGAGSNTLKTYGLDGITDIWDTTANEFDFSGLALGDTVDFRVDVTWTTNSTNEAVSLRLKAAVGTASEFTLPIVTQKNFKTSGTHREVYVFSMYIGNANTKDNAAYFEATTDTNGSDVTPNGWFVRALQKDEV